MEMRARQRQQSQNLNKQRTSSKLEEASASFLFGGSIMQNISEVAIIIDNLENKINEYSDKTMWKASNSTDWHTWMLSEGPKIVESWRELAALIRLTPGDELMALMARLDNIKAMVANQDVMNLAMKLNKSAAPPSE
jgi:hypothetical protein